MKSDGTEDEQIKELGMSLGMKMSKVVPTGVTYETAVGTAVNMLDEATGISTYEDETGKTQYYTTVGLDGETYHVIYERRGAYCWSPDLSHLVSRVPAT